MHDREVLALDLEGRKLAEEWQRSDRRLGSARAELDRIGRERTKIDEIREAAKGDLAAKDGARSDQEESLAAAQDEIEDLKSELARVSEEHSTLRARLASFEERHRAAAAARERSEIRLKELTRRQDHLDSDKQRLLSERGQLEASNQELGGRREELTSVMTNQDQKVKELSLKEGEIRTELASLEELLRGLRQKLQNAQESRSSLQVAMARYESDLDYLDQNSRNELHIGIRELAAEVKVLPDESELPELDRQYQELRR